MYNKLLVKINCEDILSKRLKDWLIGTAIVLIMIILIVILVNRVSSTREYEGVSLSAKGDKVAVVELNGPIYDSRNIVRQFKKYGEHKSVKAVLFRINSPGGAVSPSQEIYNAVKRVRDGGKPVVVSMGTVAASGGYYVSLAADTIMANPGSTTGSIGVIIEITNLSRLFTKLGIGFEVVKTGPFKDTGSPHRNLTQADRRFLQSYVDDAFEQFLKVVSEERHMSMSDVRRLADGRVFTGHQARENGLIDVLGDYEDAVQLAAAMGGIEGEPTLVREVERHRSVYDLLFQEFSRVVRGTSSQVQYRL